MTQTRRGLITGLVGFVACTPAIVRVGSLMKYSRVPFTEADYWKLTGMMAQIYGLERKPLESNEQLRERLLDCMMPRTLRSDHIMEFMQ
jgi:hypothetical protein